MKSRILVGALFLLGACASTDTQTPGRAAARGESTLADAGAEAGAKQDPRTREVPVDALSGWRGTLVVDQGPIGIWTVVALQVYRHYACPEIVGLDDAGRLSVFWCYSGKWTPVSTVHDGKWLGGLAQADLDPRTPGEELYTGSQNGNLYQVTVHGPTFLDSRMIARVPGREIHTLVGGDLDRTKPGGELVAFTNPGGLYLLRARSDGRDGFDIESLGDISGRIRDAVLLPTREGEDQEIATVGRHGKLETLRFVGGRPEWTTVNEAPMGMGRIALRPGATAEHLVLYSVADDGRVWRHERDEHRAWTNELIYLGPQGMRGCAAGRFDADPAVETLAVFGYSQRVELLSRRADGWSAETIFVDRDKGHWITTGEFDGRNSTDELVTSGYSGRIVLLARPPGYGLPGVRTFEP